jgi:uncharacterized protein involved in exopolysaccharide biosynthesis
MSDEVSRMTETPPSPQWTDSGADEDAPSLPAFVSDPIGVLRRRWHWMVLAWVIGLFATGVATYLNEPIFSATATVLITGQQIPERFVATTVKEDSISTVNAMVGQVLSHENLLPLIESYGLFAEETQRGASSGDLVRKFRGRTDVHPGAPISRSRRNENALIVEIDHRSEDPNEAADVANALASLFIEASIERRSGQARKATEFLRRQLARDEREQRARAKEAAEFRREHRGELPSELDSNLRRLELSAGRLELLGAQIQSKQSQILALEALPGTQAPSADEALLDELRRQLASATASYTDEHPNVVSLRDRLSRLEGKVAKERSARGTSARILAEQRELAVLMNQKFKTQQQIDELTLRVDRTPAIGEQLTMLAQREQVSRENYLTSLRKVEEAELAESLESAQQGALVKILDPALPPSSPDRPSSMVALVGLMGSLGLALAIAVLAELVDPVIVGAAQIEQLVDAEFLGAMPTNTR